MGPISIIPAVFFITSWVFAQQMLLGVGDVSHGGSFVGPADGVSNIRAAYSTRRLLSSYTGGLIRVRRSSDNAEQDIGYVSNGDLDTTSLSSFVGANSGYVTKWYDQSGNGDHLVPVSTANEATLVSSGTIQTVNSKACMNSTAQNQTYTVTLGAALNNATSEVYSAFSTSASGANVRAITLPPATGQDWNSTNGWAPISTDGAGAGRMTYREFGGPTALTVAAGTFKSIYARTTLTTLFISDGTNTQSQAARNFGNLNSTKFTIGDDGSGSTNAPIGYNCEAVITTTQQSDYTTYLTNMQTYWGS